MKVESANCTTLKNEFRSYIEYWLNKAKKTIDYNVRTAIDELFDRIEWYLSGQVVIDCLKEVKRLKGKNKKEIYQPIGWLARKVQDHHKDPHDENDIGLPGSRLKTKGMVTVQLTRIQLEAELKQLKHHVQPLENEFKRLNANDSWYEDTQKSVADMNRQIADIELKLRKTGRPLDTLDLITDTLIKGLQELGLKPTPAMLLKKNIVKNCPYGLVEIVLALNPNAIEKEYSPGALKQYINRKLPKKNNS